MKAFSSGVRDYHFDAMSLTLILNRLRAMQAIRSRVYHSPSELFLKVMRLSKSPRLSQICVLSLTQERTPHPVLTRIIIFDRFYSHYSHCLSNLSFVKVFGKLDSTTLFY
ncbi:uncharacterized protein MELLADRAFT_71777 [Melampsora larici-populina 98AG31]|uniref:Uncharacterized protein n=1 Tax=Melampsora larici-populina (strain 98AG31 / pathotype 3-4-7) TaxID=747676 RepID=F4RKE3_MELLP|nr:uncharacterized protein MELLADRAFT_71777 [Melampsora larici-populina 98AG31]EGG07080.1 hypothetical protein MELLADRAFT_71777 [Melampsora larici-populina 98AG31]